MTLKLIAAYSALLGCSLPNLAFSSHCPLPSSVVVNRSGGFSVLIPDPMPRIYLPMTGRNPSPRFSGTHATSFVFARNLGYLECHYNGEAILNGRTITTTISLLLMQRITPDDSRNWPGNLCEISQQACTFTAL